MIVLITAYKVAGQSVHFNFEAVYQKYKSYMKNHTTQMGTIS